MDRALCWWRQLAGQTVVPLDPGWSS